MTDIHCGWIMPLGSKWKSYSMPSLTTVWPALLPPCEERKQNKFKDIFYDSYGFESLHFLLLIESTNFSVLTLPVNKDMDVLYNKNTTTTPYVKSSKSSGMIKYL